MTNKMELGKLPPQAIDLEKAVLGAIMLESSSFIEVSDILKPSSFYVDSHVKIYKSVCDIYAKNKPIDILTVTEQLRCDNVLEDVGGAVYLAQLTADIASGAHIEFHARIIQQKFIQRELIRMSCDIQNKAFENNDDVDELLNFAESQLFSITQGSVKKEPKIIGEIGKEQLRLLEEISKSDEQFSGVPTGLHSLDVVINGFQNKKLIILAARPAMGKTTLIISMAKNMAIDFNKKVAIFSLEMGEDELWGKFISDLTDIQAAKLSGCKINDDQWQPIEYAQRKLEDSKIFIDDTAGISLFELRAKARRLKIRHGIDIIFIDYLQLMSGDKGSGNREQEISNISRGLKSMAKDLDIPIVCLSQLNRGVETRPDKKPQLSDLRESGAIEQDADIVGFIYRPEYYGFEEYGAGESTANKVDIIIQKHRAGKTGEISLDRTPNFTRIYDKSSELISTVSNNIDNTFDNSDIEPNTSF